MHSGWVSGSNNGNGVGADGAAELCEVARRSRKRPATDEGAEACEDALMVMTSPLTAKVGLWDAAGEDKRKAKSLQLASDETLLNHSFPQTFKFLRASCMEEQ